MTPARAFRRSSIIITVDLEDWFQVENLRASFPHEKWESCELRVEQNTMKLLDLFEAYGVRATFFVLGWVAERCSGLIRSIHGMGHEIASHGYLHRICHGIPAAELREDLQKSRNILFEITGAMPLGYRAPNFSITRDLVHILDELDFSYDSSYNSFTLNKRHGRIDGLAQEMDGHFVFQNGIRELPVSNLGIAGQTFPWAGGGYFRLWPAHLFEFGVARILRDQGYYVFFCHPWEIDPAQPRQVRGIGSISRFRHYLNLDKSLNKLRHFLAAFEDSRFISCADHLGLTHREL